MSSPAKDRPSYITFEMRSVEDRAASIAEGHYIAKDVPFVVVTPPGGNLVFEEPAQDWLAKKKNDKFFDHYSNAFKAWQSGQEEPEVGVPIKSWASISPAQAATCLAANIRTVEDLATAPAGALQRIGMGAVALQKKAQAWLQSASDTGKTAEELVSLRRDKEEMGGQIAALTQKIAALESEIRTPKKSAKAS
jgi:hypothetical protein